MPRPPSPAEVLRLNREQARALAGRVGEREVGRLLAAAANDLRQRIDAAVRLGSATPMGIEQMRATLAQVQATATALAKGLGEVVVGAAGGAAELGAEGMLDYLQAAQQRLGGVARPLPLREASMLSRAVSGAQSTVLRRLATTQAEQQRQDEAGTTPVDEGIPPAPTRPGGVLARYTMATIGQFEEILQVGMVARKPWGDVRDELVQASPFLQGQPKFWAERIARTETMGAYNRAGWEGIRSADDDLGDVVKVLSATFDTRTGWDSYQLHGQIRRPDEPFEWNGGLYMHPPNRPNDREVVVPHRLEWPLPAELRPRSDADVMAAWRRDGRKGSPPRRPQQTTVPLERFGK